MRGRIDWSEMTVGNWIGFLLSMLLGVVFLRSAVPKLRHPKGFILTVLEYRMLPAPLSRAYARVVPPLELWLALVFLTGIAPRLAGTIAAMLLASFVVGVSVNLIRGRDLDCGCFGESKQRRIGWGLVVQEIGLLAACVVNSVFGRDWAPLRGLSTGGAPDNRVVLLGLMMWLAVTACISVLLARVGQKEVQPGRALVTAIRNHIRPQIVKGGNA